MSRVAVIIDDLFEDVEYTEPVSAFENAGHDIVHIGLQKGKEIEGKRKKTKVIIDESLKDVSVNDFDALLIPGGYSPDKLRVSDNATNFVKDFMTSNKPIFSICHAPQILISARVLNGKKVTGWKSIIQDIKNAGAEFVDEEVVVDDNLVSSRSPKDLQAFIKTSLKKLEGDE